MLLARLTFRCGVVAAALGMSLLAFHCVPAGDELQMRLLSHLQDAADEKSSTSTPQIVPDSPIVRPKRPRILADELPYAGPPASIDGPNLQAAPLAAPFDEAETLPAVPGIRPEELQAF